jgi:hypothetical protein
MTDPAGIELRDYRLAPHEHLSGCPGKKERQESYFADRPPVTGLVASGTTETGEPIFVSRVVPGEKVIVARCMDCGADRILKIGEATGVVDG